MWSLLWDCWPDTVTEDASESWSYLWFHDQSWVGGRWVGERGENEWEQSKYVKKIAISTRPNRLKAKNLKQKHYGKQMLLSWFQYWVSSKLLLLTLICIHLIIYSFSHLVSFQSFESSCFWHKPSKRSNCICCAKRSGFTSFGRGCRRVSVPTTPSWKSFTFWTVWWCCTHRWWQWWLFSC